MPDAIGRRSYLVFFAPSPSEAGGAQQRARLLSQALVERGWKVLLIGRTASGRHVGIWSLHGVTVIEIPGFGRRRLGALVYIVVGLALGVATWIRAAGYLALQLSSPATAAAACGLLTRRPFVIMSSTSGVLSEISLMRGPTGAARRVLLRAAAAVVAQTNEAAGELAAAVPGVRTAVLPNPVIDRNHSSLSGEPRVAYAGRFSEEKDLPRLLAAWELLVAEQPQARLTLIGAGGAYRSVEKRLRGIVDQSPALRATVRFTGWLENPTPELCSADVFVFPSRSEGMSNALLEACALGRIVVASDIAPNVAVVGRDYPLLFLVGDVDSLLSALRASLTDEEVRSRSLSAISNRMNLFSPSAIAERLEQILLDEDRSRH